MKIENAKLRVAETRAPTGFTPKRLSAFSDSNRSEIVYLDVENLVPYQNQARRIFQEEDIAQLAQTIKDHGIRQPLTVIKRTPESLVFEVVSGERRLRAARIAGIDRVPCIVLLDLEKAEEIALIENIQRSDLHPIELSGALKDLAARRGWGGQAEIAQKLCMAPSYVSETLKLARLSDVVQNALLNQNIRGRDALRKVCSLSTEQAQIDYVASLDPDYSKIVTDGRQAAIRKESVLRVFMEGSEVVGVQGAKIKKLNIEQKKALIQSLEGVILEIMESLD